MTKIVTQFPIAFDSPDHIHPWGTMIDNNTSLPLIKALAQDLGGGYRLMDIGCSGGQFVVDAISQGNFAIGLEGSDYSVRTQRANWPTHFNTDLFLCDVSREFQVVDDAGAPILFDVITAWEVAEHIFPDRLPTFFQNIRNHLKPSGIVLISISFVLDERPHGVNLHVAAHLSMSDWEELMGKHFIIHDYPYNCSVREEIRLRQQATSKFLMLEVKQ